MTDMLLMQTIALYKDKLRQQLVSHASTILQKSRLGDKYCTFKYEYKYKYQVLHLWAATDQITIVGAAVNCLSCI